MRKTFDELCEVYPQLRTLKPLTIDRISCDKEGYNSSFWNEYSIFKFYLDRIFRRLGMDWTPEYTLIRDIIIDHFIDESAKEWERLDATGYFDEETTEEEWEKKQHRHNNLIQIHIDLQKQEYGKKL